MPEGQEAPRPQPQQRQEVQQPRQPEQSGQQNGNNPEAKQQADSQAKGKDLQQQLNTAEGNPQQVEQILEKFSEDDAPKSASETPQSEAGEANKPSSPENKQAAQQDKEQPDTNNKTQEDKKPEKEAKDVKELKTKDDVLDAYTNGDISKAEMEAQMRTIQNNASETQTEEQNREVTVPESPAELDSLDDESAVKEPSGEDLDKAKKERIDRMDTQLDAAGVDPESPLGQEIKNFLEANPDKAVRIDRIITTLTTSKNALGNEDASQITSDIDQSQANLSNFQQEINGEKNPLRRRILQALFVVLQTLLIEVMKAAAATAKETAEKVNA